MKNLRFSNIVRYFESFGSFNKNLQDHTKWTEYAKKMKMAERLFNVCTTMAVAITAMLDGFYSYNLDLFSQLRSYKLVDLISNSG